MTEFDSYIRGYHAYQDIWNPVVGESLLLKREPDNSVDSSAVAVWREDEIVGHVPFNIASVLSQFLRRDCNQGFVEVTGKALIQDVSGVLIRAYYLFDITISLKPG